MADRYASLKQGLVGAWIPSISGSGLLLPDLSGRGNNGSLVNMDASDWVSVQYGRALDFDGSNDFVSLPVFSTMPFSISCWALSRNTETIQSIVSITSNASINPLFALYFRGDLPGDPIWAQMRGSDSSSNTAAIFGGYSVNVWYHIVAVFHSASRRQIYVNGVAGTEDTTTHTVELLNTQTIGALRRTTDIAFLDGQVDDVRQYNRALTESEIRLLASEPGIGFKPAKKLSRFSQRFTYKPPKAKVFEGVRVRDHDYASLRVGLVGAWCPSLPNGGSGNTLPDVSGRGNHGTLTNMGPEDWVSGQYGRALDFDGTDDYISIAHSSFLNASNAFSLSCWIMTGADITTEQHVIAKSFLSPSLNIGYRLYIQASAFRWYLSPDGGAAPNRVFRFSTDIAANTLYHVVGTFLGPTLLDVYLNGRLANSGLTGTIPTSVFATSAPLLFGAQGNAITTATGFFAGRIDDVRLYNRVLNQCEIRLLASRPGIGLQPSPTRFIAREKKTGLRRKILTGQT